MRRIVASLVVTAVLGTAGMAYAQSQPADPTVAHGGDGAPAEDGRGRRPAPLVRRALHGDLVVRGDDGGPRQVTFDRGRVATVSADSITLTRPDGVSVTVPITPATTFTGTPADLLRRGAPVVVVQSGGDAVRVISRAAGLRPRIGRGGESRPADKSPRA